jgi:hypothetical protein
MKKVPEKFSKKGFKHVLIKREESVALYKRKSEESGHNWHYEVVIIAVHDGTYINGNLIEAGEIYPSTSQWGMMGWTYNDINMAEKKFSKVLKKVQTSVKNKESKSNKKN